MFKQERYSVLCDTDNQWHVQDKTTKSFVYDFHGEYKDGLAACKKWINEQKE